jgi:hypothetical protein
MWLVRITVRPQGRNGRDCLTPLDRQAPAASRAPPQAPGPSSSSSGVRPTEWSAVLMAQRRGRWRGETWRSSNSRHRQSMTRCLERTDPHSTRHHQTAAKRRRWRPFPCSNRRVACTHTPDRSATGAPATHALPTLPTLVREELRLDVDGRYPQMVASGTLFLRLQARMHWIANLATTGPDTYAGAIWYTDGDTNLLPYTSVSIQARRSFFPNLRTATVTFSAAGKTDRVRTFRFADPSFHPVELEYDTVAGTTAVAVACCISCAQSLPGVKSQAWTMTL